MLAFAIFGMLNWDSYLYVCKDPNFNYNHDYFLGKNNPFLNNLNIYNNITNNFTSENFKEKYNFFHDDLNIFELFEGSDYNSKILRNIHTHKKVMSMANAFNLIICLLVSGSICFIMGLYESYDYFLDSITGRNGGNSLIKYLFWKVIKVRREYRRNNNILNLNNINQEINVPQNNYNNLLNEEFISNVNVSSENIRLNSFSTVNNYYNNNVFKYQIDGKFKNNHRSHSEKNFKELIDNSNMYNKRFRNTYNLDNNNYNFDCDSEESVNLKSFSCKNVDNLKNVL